MSVYYLLANIGFDTAENEPAKKSPNSGKMLLVPLQLKVALSRRIEKHWRLIGWGEIVKGKEQASE